MSQYPFELTKYIRFELSNLCQLAHVHAKCPLHINSISQITTKEPNHLPSKVVLGALSELSGYRFDGEIGFHNYNEPLIDPRLFEFINWARQCCPRADIIIITNGVNLSYQLAFELSQIGVNRLLVSEYGTDEDVAKMQKLVSQVEPLFEVCDTLTWGKRLDDRLDNYTRQEQVGHGVCYAPLSEVIVRHTGDVCLCCRDWASTVTFGNLKLATLSSLLAGSEMRTTYGKLSLGDRSQYDVCRRCTSTVTR